MLPENLNNRIAQLTNDGNVRFNCAQECHAKRMGKRNTGWRAPLFLEHLIWAHYHELPFNRHCTGCEAKFFGTIDAVDHACTQNHEISSVPLDGLVKEYREARDRASLIAHWEKPFFAFVQKTTLQNIQTLLDEGYLQLGRLSQTGNRISTMDSPTHMFDQDTRNAVEEVDYGEKVRDVGTEQQQKRILHQALVQNGLYQPKSYMPSTPRYDDGGASPQYVSSPRYAPSPRYTPQYNPRNNMPGSDFKNGGFAGDNMQRGSSEIMGQRPAFGRDDSSRGRGYRGRGGGGYRGQRGGNNYGNNSRGGFHGASNESMDTTDDARSPYKRFGTPLEAYQPAKRGFGSNDGANIDQPNSPIDKATKQDEPGKDDERKRRARSYSRSDSD